MSFHGKANVQYILDITPLNEVLPAKLPASMAWLLQPAMKLCFLLACLSTL